MCSVFPLPDPLLLKIQQSKPNEQTTVDLSHLRCRFGAGLGAPPEFLFGVAAGSDFAAAFAQAGFAAGLALGAGRLGAAFATGALGITVLRAPRGKYHWMVGHSPGFEKP